MCMLDRIRSRREKIRRLAVDNRIDRVYVFGSCARKEERPDSDIDFLIDPLPGSSLLNQVHMRDGLISLFGRDVDLVSRRGLSPLLRDSIIEEAVPL